MADQRSTGWARLRLYGGIGIGLALLALFLSSIDVAELTDTLKATRWRWLVAAVGAILVHYLAHGLRWKVLLRHVVPGVELHTIWRATTVLWAFNTLLPLRAGSLLRPAVVAMNRDVPYTTLLFTMVAETVCDVFGTVGLVLVALVLLPDALADSPQITQMKTVGTWVSVIALVALGGIVLLSSRGARSAIEAATAPIPSSRIRERVMALFDQLVEGMAAVRSPRQLVEALAITVLVWGAWLAAVVFTLWAFRIELPIGAAVFIEASLTVAMMLPQAPGFLGTFQVVTEKVLVVFGAPAGASKAVALVLWVVCFVPITLLGVWDAWRMGMSISPGSRRETFSQLAGAADERVSPPHPPG
ncbi:MAG: lysylphosphatidylglycerol synthase transmembrane domain-containing protein [Myxococcota bacterium]